eukprot:g6865.t1
MDFEATERAPLLLAVAPRTHEAVTPVPCGQLAVLLIAFFADALCVTFLMPLMPFMVQHFFEFPEGDQNRIGYYVALLGASYEVGQIVAGPFWGALSDRLGRRPVMLLCSFASVLLVVAFGFSRSYGMAVALRLCQGLAAGTLPVARTCLGDLTDATNEARAFALMGITWGFGDIVGPTLGGLLATPATHVLGGASALRLSLYALACAPVWPALVTLTGWQQGAGPAAGGAGVWAMVALAIAFKALGCESVFSGLSMLVQGSVHAGSGLHGAAQGVGGSALSAGLALGPMWSAPLFAVLLGLSPRLGEQQGERGGTGDRLEAFQLRAAIEGSAKAENWPEAAG